MIIETKGLVKKFGDVTALKGIDLSVGEGEVFGFIGPNGAGKSTTIRILLGILKATAGTASVFGLDAWNNSVEIHKKIAYVPGDVNLWPNLTGGEVIDFFGNLRGGINEEKRKKLIADFDLDTRKKSRTYSKGNRQKVALVSAFASDADLYILDEPTSGLDPLMERIFVECVLECKRAGKSVLLSSHILSEVEKLCDRVGIISNGTIVETGTLDCLRQGVKTHMTVVANKPLAGLDKVGGVSNIRTVDGETLFDVEPNATGGVLKFLTAYDLTKFECAPPALEELFMKYYDGGQSQK